MSTLTMDRRLSPTYRILATARVLMANPAMALLLPLGILASSFVVNIMIFASVDAIEEGGVTGGLLSIYFTQFIVCWIGVHQFFSFSVGLNATRRAYYVAAVLVSIGQALFFSIVLYLGGIIERATDGWGIKLHFFDPMPLTSSNSPVTILVYAVPLVLVSCLGLLQGAVSKRFGTRGFFLILIVGLVVAGGLVVLINELGAWPGVGSWLADLSGLSVAIGWALIPSALAGAVGWWALRRATP
jgi:hypothetical protein